LIRSLPGVDHLAIPVRDQERSRRSYETHCGFGAQPARRYDDGVLMCRRWDRLVEECDEPGYFSVKCRDPDGYIVELSWEPEP